MNVPCDGTKVGRVREWSALRQKGRDQSDSAGATAVLTASAPGVAGGSGTQSFEAAVHSFHAGGSPAIQHSAHEDLFLAEHRSDRVSLDLEIRSSSRSAVRDAVAGERAHGA